MHVVPGLIEKSEPRIGVKVAGFSVLKMIETNRRKIDNQDEEDFF